MVGRKPRGGGEPAGKTLVNHRQDQDSGDDDQRRRSRECLSTPPASPVGIVSRSRPIHGGTGGKSARARDTPGTRLRERRSMCYIASSLLYESAALLLPFLSLSLSLSLSVAIVDAYRRFDECYCVYRTLLFVSSFSSLFSFFLASLFLLSFFSASAKDGTSLARVSTHFSPAEFDSDRDFFACLRNFYEFRRNFDLLVAVTVPFY